ncbi:NAD(P)H-dependent oxidoreductase subunit E [Chitinispirillales bacterium ANBcel5]|uniref:NADH-quinone oxidoreductase subunit NuoE family protein n=1 Tax=Cellulosispirillum alkaliphilum TaxID=3039283 RepID=UPI002A56B26E|nr:NAD(P)H-dependent oxidoreductase subunit E [Chitinispirillales bacterium ANBcel5]
MPQSMPVLTELTPELRNFIKEWKDKPGNLIMILHKVQEIYKFIPRDVAFTVSKELNVPLAKIYGVMTFYHYFKLEKPGEHIISVCMGTACYLKGGEDLIKELEVRLGTGVNSTTEDGKFTIEAVRCVGCCGLAPVMTIDGEVYGGVKCAQIPEILEKYS